MFNTLQDVLSYATGLTAPNGEALENVFTGITELGLSHSETDEVFKTLRTATGATLTSLRRDFADYVRANGLASDSGRDSTATAIVKLAEQDKLELWRDLEGEPWATLSFASHVEHHPLKAKEVKTYLARLHWQSTNAAANSAAVADAIVTLAAKARDSGQTHRVYVRIAELDSRIYIDLANETWQTVEVTAAGWRVIEARDCPVRFRRSRGMLPLPLPAPGGTLTDLAGLLNLHGKEWTLILAWLVQALRGAGPYPVLAVTGEQESGKSVLTKALRRLVDPNVSPLRSMSRDERDMLIAARNTWCIAYDNLSGLPGSVSDALCRLSTGGGLATRALFTDDDEMLLDAQRPVILNGITDIISRQDLVSRAIMVQLQPIEKRRTEKELWHDFATVWPGVFGALLSAVARGLADLPHTQLDTLPRMADFALWATACERGLGLADGAVMAAYHEVRSDLEAAALEAEVIVEPLLALAERHTEGWEGPATALLELLAEVAGYAGEHAKRPPRDWPKSGKGLADALKRLAPALRRQGVAVEQGKRQGRKGTRAWRLYRVVQTSVSTVSSVSNSGERRQVRNNDADTHADTHTPADTRSVSAKTSVSSSVSQENGVQHGVNGPADSHADTADTEKPNSTTRRETRPWEDVL